MDHSASAQQGLPYLVEVLLWGVLLVALVWGVKLLWDKLHARLAQAEPEAQAEPVPVAETVGQAIQENRKRCGLTQDKLGKKLSVSRQTISKWENNVVAPGPVHLCALAAVFGIPADKLVPELAAESTEDAAK